MSSKKNKQKNYVHLIAYCALIIIILLLIIIIMHLAKKKNIDKGLIIESLQEQKVLQSAKLKYKGYYYFNDDGITFVNKGDFLMTYSAEAIFGVSLEDPDVSINQISKKVTIKLPEVKLLSVDIDDNEIKYYDEKFAPFNFDDKEDAGKAKAEAEFEARKDLETDYNLKFAEDTAKNIVKGLLEIVPSEYKVEVKFEG